MSDRWFYRMFGEEFGPVGHTALMEMIEKGTVGEEDEIRGEDSAQWVPIHSINGLKKQPASNPVSHVSQSGSDPEIKTGQTTTSQDDWYWSSNGHELGPVSFDELVTFAEQRQLGVDDDVKLGLNGKWRRVGSIGRLMAALPYQAPVQSTQTQSKTPAKQTRSASKVTTEPTQSDALRTAPSKTAESAAPPSIEPAATPEIDLNATYHSAYEQAKAQITQSMVQQAEAAFKQAEDAAKAEIAWASAPNVDPMWYGFMGGIEFGPVPFAQVLALAKNGQLKPADFLRNGINGQYFPSANAPGLYSAVSALAKANEAFLLAKAQAQAAASLSMPAPSPRPVVGNRPTPVNEVSVVNTREETPHVSLAASRASDPTQSQSKVIQPKQSASKSDPNATAVGTGSAKQEPSNSSAQRLEHVSSHASAPSSKSSPEFRVASSTEQSVRSSNPSIQTSMASMSSRASSFSNPVNSTPSRPVSRPRRPYSESSLSMSSIVEAIKSPNGLGAIGFVAAILLVFGWLYLPKGHGVEIKLFHELRQVVDAIKQKRLENATDFTDVVNKGNEIGRNVAARIGKSATSDQPIRQFLLWAARDRMPTMLSNLKTQPTQQSTAELSYIDCLRQAAKIMNIKEDGLPPAPPPPPEDPNLVADVAP